MSGASDPRVLLDAMSSMLGENGDMKGPQEVLTIIRYTKESIHSQTVDIFHALFLNCTLHI